VENPQPVEWIELKKKKKKKKKTVKQCPFSAQNLKNLALNYKTLKTREMDLCEREQTQ